MSITPKQKKIVQVSFDQVSDMNLLATYFYQRLFFIAPETQALFHGDMNSQRVKLVQTLDVVVSSLNNLDIIIPEIENLGKRHVTYGVTPAHWDSVGQALIWALADVLGTVFTEEVREAWLQTYQMIARIAINAAYNT